MIVFTLKFGMPGQNLGQYPIAGLEENVFHSNNLWESDRSTAVEDQADAGGTGEIMIRRCSTKMRISRSERIIPNSLTTECVNIASAKDYHVLMALQAGTGLFYSYANLKRDGGTLWDDIANALLLKHLRLCRSGSLGLLLPLRKRKIMRSKFSRWYI